VARFIAEVSAVVFYLLLTLGGIVSHDWLVKSTFDAQRDEHPHPCRRTRAVVDWFQLSSVSFFQMPTGRN
jgi:hypothetical protein